LPKGLAVDEAILLGKETQAMGQEHKNISVTDEKGEM
jgi:hypothetical protein